MIWGEQIIDIARGLRIKTNSKLLTNIASEGMLANSNVAPEIGGNHYKFGGASGVIGSLLFIIPCIFFLSYSLFLIDFYSIFILPFQGCRVILVASRACLKHEMTKWN